jgi:hypothetical protein
MIPNDEVANFIESETIANEIESGLIVDGELPWGFGRVVPVSLMALRMQHPYIPLELPAQRSSIAHVAAGGSLEMEVPANCQILTLTSYSGGAIVSLGGSIAVPSAGDVATDQSCFIMANNDRRIFGVQNHIPFVRVYGIVESWISAEFYMQAG